MIPFLVLSYLNANVYIVIRRRRKHLGQRFMNAESNAFKAGTTDALVQRLNALYAYISEHVQGSAIRWSLGCVNPGSWLPLAAGASSGNLESRDHPLADPCTAITASHYHKK